MYSSWSTALAVVSFVFLSLACLAVALRLRARRVKSSPYSADDYVIMFALAVTAGLCCVSIHGAFAGGFGQSLSAMTPAEISEYQKHLFTQAILAYLSIGVVKISVLLFYKRIFVISRFRLVANITIVLVCVWTVSAIFLHVFSRWPVWTFWTGGRSRFNYGLYTTVYAGLDVLLDLITLCLPLPVIKKLQISFNRKIALVGIFWLGFFCVIAASVRLYYAYLLSLNAATIEQAQFSYASVNTVIWSELEPCCSIIAACLPTLGPLFRSGYSLATLARSIRSRALKLSGSSVSEASTNDDVAALRHNVNDSAIETRKRHQLQENNSNMLYSQDVEPGSTETDQKDSGRIRVERTFASHVENA